jgi:hypothetical protein
VARVQVEFIGGPCHGHRLTLDARDVGALVAAAMLDGEPVAMTPFTMASDVPDRLVAAETWWHTYYSWPPAEPGGVVRYGLEPWPDGPPAAGASN